jgi:hypothetical protein
MNKQEDTQTEFDEELLRIYKKNMTRIINISKWIEIFKTTSIIAFLSFLIVLAVRLVINFPWYFLLIPSLITLLTFTLYLNNYLKLKDIFDEEASNSNISDKNEDNSSQIGSILSYSCLNLSALCLMIYLILLSAKIENVLYTAFNTIGIPIYIMAGIFLFYAIFIMPAFISNKLIAEIILIFVYILGFSIFFVLFNMRLDKNIQISYLQVFSPIITTFVLNVCYTIYSLIISRDVLQSHKMGEFFLVFSILTAVILIPLKLDGFIHIMDWIIVAIVIFGGICYFVDNLSNYVKKEEEDDKIGN